MAGPTRLSQAAQGDKSRGIKQTDENASASTSSMLPIFWLRRMILPAFATLLNLRFRDEFSILASALRSGFFFLPVILALCGASADAQTYAKAGMLTCDVSAGIGLIPVQKRKLNCLFSNHQSGPPDAYVGAITERLARSPPAASYGAS